MIDLTADPRPARSTRPPRKTASGSSRSNPDKHAYRITPQALKTRRKDRPTTTATASGVSVYGYRYYQSLNGMWLSRDPISEKGGLNLYGFVRNSGVSAVDYLGLDFIAIGVGSVTPLGIKHLSLEYWKSKCAQGVNYKFDPGEYQAGGTSIDDVIDLHPDNDWRYVSDSLNGPIESSLLISTILHPAEQANNYVVVAFEPTQGSGVDDLTVEIKWNAIVNTARQYPYAEWHPIDKSSSTQKWPNNQYQPLGNNSNTFVRWVASILAIPIPANVGSTIGRNSPQRLSNPPLYILGPYHKSVSL